MKLTEQMETILQQEQERHPDSSTVFQDARTGQPYTPSRLYYLHNQILTAARLPKMGFRELQLRVEVADYLDAVGQLGYSAMFALAIHYGLRQRELIALKWSDVDMEKPSLTVHAGRVVKEGKLVEYAGKVRELQLSLEDAALLQQEHAKHPSSEVLFIPEP